MTPSSPFSLIAESRLEETILFGIPQSSFEKCDALAFLKYHYQLMDFKAELNHRDAGRVIVELLVSNIAPRSLWPYLLLESLPLLEASSPVFTSVETMELMRCAEEAACCVEKSSSDFVDSTSWRVLKLALVRNLARSSVMQFA